MIIASTYVMLPLAVLLLLSLKVRSVGLHEAAQTATAGLVTLIPEGLVLLMSVTFAVAAVRLAKRETLVQQMSATESLAAVDTICVDKTGTLTEGELRLAGVEFADGVDPAAGAAALGRFAACAGDRNKTLETIAERYPGEAGRSAPRSPSPPSGSGAASPSPTAAAAARDLRARRPRRPRRGGRADPAAGAGDEARGGDRGGAPGRRLRPDQRGAAGRPGGAAAPRLVPLALIVLEETLRPDAAETIAFMREQEVDLKLISGDAGRHRDRGRLRGRGAARGRRRRGPRPARRPRGAGRGRRKRTRSSAGSSRSRRKRWSRRWSPPAATWR